MLRRTLGSFSDEINVAGDVLGVPVAVIHKDYWVTQILRVLASNYRDQFVFKGGTSLSKCHGLIQRFSEDIDILVLAEQNQGRNGRETVLKGMISTVEQDLEVPTEKVNSSKGAHRSAEVAFPSSTDFSSSSNLFDRVLIELGYDGGPTPNQDRQVGTLLGDVLASQGGIHLEDHPDLTPFQVRTLSPHRTLIEKLLNLARLTDSDLGGISQATRQMRHFYDVFCLLKDQQVITDLANTTQTTEIFQSSLEVSEKYGNAAVIPATGMADLACFVDPQMGARIEPLYEQCLDDLMFRNARPGAPTWDDVRLVVTEHQELLRFAPPSDTARRPAAGLP